MIIRSAILVTVLAGLASLCSADNISFSNVNPAGAYTQAEDPSIVTSTPSGPAFTLLSPTVITEVFTYHQVGIAPATVDSVGIEDTDTDTFYWWVATGNITGDGQWAYPNVVVPAGDYVVIDQSPTTWSVNGGSGWTGMSEVDGTNTPEPASLVLLAPGLLLLLRKRRAA